MAGGFDSQVRVVLRNHLQWGSNLLGGTVMPPPRQQRPPRQSRQRRSDTQKRPRGQRGTKRSGRTDRQHRPNTANGQDRIGRSDRENRILRTNRQDRRLREDRHDRAGPGLPAAAMAGAIRHKGRSITKIFRIRRVRTDLFQAVSRYFSKLCPGI